MFRKSTKRYIYFVVISFLVEISTLLFKAWNLIEKEKF